MARSTESLESRVRALTRRDETRLRRLLRDPKRPAAAVEQALAEAEGRLERRAQAATQVRRGLRYPEELPISSARDELVEAIRDHQVVIVEGETGSGKSTQLPKLCLELGRGVRGLIGHTQPRRLAARAVAERVAEELGSAVGGAVGYAVRFTDRVGESTLIKVMTDGILLAEIHRDRHLDQYDTIIVDEVHERSLNIDFLLGYLHRLLPRRPDLRVILTSATADIERLSAHFDGAPVLRVSGRSYPVEIRYRPVGEDADDADDADDHDDADVVGEVGEGKRLSAKAPPRKRARRATTPARRADTKDQVQAIGEAVAELCQEGPGDILVFLSGEREIRDAAEALARFDSGLELLPLYARLSIAEQHRVFAPHTGRRVVLATNVAESSLTVPGIRYVVDAGTARISRYSARTKVQRLPIEAVSQASANQRAGRCGRVAPGICIRLYHEEDYEHRPAFTDPEILRTNLASVILQMAALDLGEVTAFPFVDPPDARQVRDGVLLLEELGAVSLENRRAAPQLTPLGRRLARLPVDPRFGRMLLAAEGEGCVREVTVIAAALSIQDPRERPSDAAAAADEKHARFADERSDFLTFVRLWDFLQERQEALSSNQFRRMCRSDFLSYLRVREWQDVVTQLERVARELRLHANEQPAEPAQVHRALLAGLLSHLGMRDAGRREYQGARGTRFTVSPGSVLAAKPPKWVMAAELVETTRLWARVAGPVQPEWAEPLAGELARYSYSDPEWDERRGGARVMERVTLFGLPIVAGRSVDLARIDPELARHLLIEEALVAGRWHGRHPFVEKNRETIRRAVALEDRLRRRDLVVADEDLFEFYDDRVPASVVNVGAFDGWFRRDRRRHERLLELRPTDVLRIDGHRIDADAYPDVWSVGELSFPVTYRFDPMAADDGATVHIPVQVLNQVAGRDFSWHIPGWRLELVTALIRTLPKAERREFLPAAEFAARLVADSGPDDGDLLDVLSSRLPGLVGQPPMPRGQWHPEQLPGYLQLNFSVEDEGGGVLGWGKDLDRLKLDLGDGIRAALVAAAPDLVTTGHVRWDFGSLPKVVHQGGVQGFPALVDERGPAPGSAATVGVTICATASEQRGSMWSGTRRLLELTCAPRSEAMASSLERRLPAAIRRVLSEPRPWDPDCGAGLSSTLEACVEAALDQLLAAAGGPAWDEDGFQTLRDQVAKELSDLALRVGRQAGEVMDLAHQLDRRLRAVTAAALRPAVDDMRGQLGRLVPCRFPTSPGVERLDDILRYLEAIDRRLVKLPENPRRDAMHMATVHAVEEVYERVAAGLASARQRAEARRLRWMIEELRVNLFAQSLGSPYPVSEKRVLKALADIGAGV